MEILPKHREFLIAQVVNFLSFYKVSFSYVIVTNCHRETGQNKLIVCLFSA